MANKILVIDDEATVRRLVSFHLNRLGFEVVPCVSGPVGVVKAKEIFPDLIIVDRVMPIMDGYDVCEKIRSDPDLEETPILMLTASEANVGDIQKAYKLKLAGYIKKTSDMGDLMTRVKEIFHKEEQRFKEKSGPLHFFQRKRGTVIILPFYTSETISRIIETLDYLAEQNIRNIVLDLSRVRNPDETLLGRISELRFEQLARFKNINLFIPNVTKTNRGHLKTYSLPYYETLDEALDGFVELMSEDYLQDIENLGE